MKQKLILAAALALCLALSACGSKAPSQEEVEAAIRDGSVTVEDALEKGWITQEWVDDYMEEDSIPAANKETYNKVGDFKTEILSGDTFTNEDLSDTVFLTFVDPEDEGFAAFYQRLVDAVEDVRAAGADIVVCSKGALDEETFPDAPFSVIAYNDSMEKALNQNKEMALGIPCTGVWYVNGALISAWFSQIDAADLAESAASFVEMSQDTKDDVEGDTAAIAMG